MPETSAPAGSLAPMVRLDIANLASYRRAALPILAALAFMAWSGGMSTAAVLLYLLGFLVAMNAFTMDDSHRLPMLYGALPVSRRTVITSHYLVGVGALLASVLLVVPTALVSQASGNGGFAQEIAAGVGIVLGTSASAAVALPLVVRLGARAMAYVAIGLMVLGALVMMAVRRLAPTLLDALTVAVEHRTLAIVAGLVLLVALWLASWRISAAWFERKDF